MFDWLHFDLRDVGLALVGAILGCVQLLFATLIKVPARAILNRYQFVRFLSELLSLIPFFEDPVYSGEWRIVWTVENSQNFPPENLDTATMHKFLHSIAAEITSKTNSDRQIIYAFVGKLDGDVITGEWLDKRNNKSGYYGSFQIVMKPTLSDAIGKWIGFSGDRQVNAGDLIWRKLL